MKGFDFKISPREGYGRIGVIAEIPVETIWAAKRAMAALINDTKDTEHFESAVKVCSIMAKVMLISPIDVDAVTAENDEFASYFTKKNEPEN